MRKELLTKLTWVFPEVIPVIEDNAGNITAIHAMAFDSYGCPYSVIQGAEDVNSPDYDPTDDNFICFMVDNKDDEFCMQGGYPSVREAIEAVEYIALVGEAPKGFYAL